ncbi:hypothetical protein ACFQ0K_10550 [Nocardioides caeni]|uniref:Integral membrane protein n=1 Tax=Nocardioides caeni TaxID=574700 RepID=A0A4S8N0Q6_9ACTN|nr:hypothetical protein [Nocardioides caeni]THV09343.1 hypothetical protein E9934_16520 [Nocardioides caeni]
MRNLTAFVLVVLATLLAPVALGSSWLTTRVDDRQEYVDTVAPLADDPDVRRVLADASASSAMAALEQYVPAALIPDALAELTRTAAREVVESPGFPDFWRQANEDLHRDVIGLLEDEDASVDGSLTVDASPLVAQVLLLVVEDFNLPATLVPEIQLEVPVVARAKVADAGPTYRTAHAVASWTPVVWAVLVALALLVATGWRGRLRTLGFGFVGVAAAAGLVLVLADPVQDRVVDGLATGQQELARVMLDALGASLPSYVRGFLWALPVGMVLIGLSLWPRRDRHQHHPHDHPAHHAHPAGWPPEHFQE